MRTIPLALTAFTFLLFAAPVLGQSDEPPSELRPTDQQALEEASDAEERGYELYHQRKYSEAELLFEQALAATERVLGDGHPDTLQSVGYLIPSLVVRLDSVYSSQGRIVDLAPLYLRAVETGERVLGKDHPVTLTLINNLAVTHKVHGRYDEAEPLYLRALETAERSLGEDHPVTLRSINNLAIFYGSQGRDGEAKPFDERLLKASERTLEASERLLGQEHPNLMDELAETYRRQGLYDESAPDFLRKSEASGRTLGEEYSDTLRTVNNLKTFFKQQDRYEEAWTIYSQSNAVATFFARALAASESVLGEEHPRTLSYAYYLAVVDNNAREQLKLRVLETRKRVLGEDDPDTLSSINILAVHYDHRGRDSEAERLYLRALEAAERTLGEEHPVTQTSVNNLAALYRQQDRFGEAEPLFVRALKANERVLGEEHPGTLSSIVNLARLYRLQSRFVDAEPLYLRALEIRERVLGQEHFDTLRSVNDLAVIYKNQGRYDEAEPLYLRALEAKGRVMGADHPDTLITANRLAVLYKIQARYGEAEPLLVRVLESNERVQRENSPGTLDSINALAEFYRLQGRNSEAEPLLVRALEANSRSVDFRQLVSILSLAQLYHVQGRFSEAEPLFDRAVETIENLWGQEDRLAPGRARHLAAVFQSLGRYGEAEPLFLRALEFNERVLGEEEPITLSSVASLASIYQDQGQYRKAEPLFVRALEVRKRVLGEAHPSTLNSVASLASIYQDQGRYGEAEPLFLRALEGRARVLGSEHPDTLVSVNNLASLYKLQGRYGEAEPLYERTLEISKRVLGIEHFSTLTSTYNLAVLLREQARYDEAEPLFLRSLEATVRIVGEEHPSSLTYLYGLARLYQKQGRLQHAEPLYLRGLRAEERILGYGHPSTLFTVNSLAELYLDSGRFSEAEPMIWRTLAGRSRVLGDAHPDLASSYGVLGALIRSHHEDPVKAAFFYKKAINMLQGVRQNMAELDADTQRSFLDKWASTYSTLQELLVDQGRFAEAEQVGRMIKDVEYTAFVRGASDADPGDQLTLTAREREWEAQLTSWIDTPNQLAGQKAALEAKQGYGKTLSALEERQLADLDAAYGAAYEEFFTRVAGWSALVESSDSELVQTEARELALQQSERMRATIGDIGQDVALLQAVAFEDSLHLFLITPGAFEHTEVDVTRSELFATIVAARAVIDEGRYEDVAQGLGRQDALQAPLGDLHRWLIAPIEDELEAAGTTTLMLNLQGQIRYIPFAALWDGDQWLTQKYQLALYTPAAQTRFAPSDVLTHGHAFGLSQATPGFDALFNVPDELRSILGSDRQAGVLEGDFLLDDDFTRAALEQSLTSPAPVLHIATHFQINPGDEASSFLVLGDGSRITLSEINRNYKFNFNGVELLTLSACETALGSDGTGMEIEGLGALAQNKGASSVMATLWQIADKTTPILMKSFYTGLAEGHLSKAAALQQAQIEMIGNPEASDPFFWAPFVLMGNWM